MNYDAFICYAESQRDFVNDVMVPKLKNTNPVWRFCLHDEDFLLGERITDNIIIAVTTSRRVVALLTQEFLDSDWCPFEFQQAHLRAMRDPSFSLILIPMEPVRNLHNIPPDMKAYLNTWTYLDRTDNHFWQKLEQALL